MMEAVDSSAILRGNISEVLATGSTTCLIIPPNSS